MLVSGAVQRAHVTLERCEHEPKLSTNVVQRSVQLRTSNILSLAHTHKKVCALVDLKMTFFLQNIGAFDKICRRLYGFCHAGHDFCDS